MLFLKAFFSHGRWSPHFYLSTELKFYRFCDISVSSMQCSRFLADICPADCPIWLSTVGHCLLVTGADQPCLASLWMRPVQQSGSQRRDSILGWFLPSVPVSSLAAAVTIDVPPSLIDLSTVDEVNSAWSAAGRSHLHNLPLIRTVHG